MIFEWIERLTEKEKGELTFLRRQSEKDVLLPIAGALGFDKGVLERLCYESGRIGDVCVGRIVRMKRELAACEAENLELQWGLDKKTMGESFPGDTLDCG